MPSGIKHTDLEQNIQRYLFREKGSLSIFLATWNLHGMCPSKENLDEWLRHSNLFTLVVIGVQEVDRDVNVRPIFSQPKLRNHQYDEMLIEYMKKTHMCIFHKYMGPIFLHGFVLKDKRDIIGEIQDVGIPRGLRGLSTNKGAVAVQLDLIESDGTPWTCLRFVNAHLASDEGKVKNRDADYNMIRNEIKNKFTVSDGIDVNFFWMGDLNYRVNAPRGCVINRMSKQREKFTRILPCDELTQEKDAGIIFKGFKEFEIKFSPTYKRKSDEYAASRTPSWTDRILIKTPSFRHCNQVIDYASIPGIELSDHDPVVLGLGLSGFEND